MFLYNNWKNEMFLVENGMYEIHNNDKKEKFMNLEKVFVFN